MKSKVLLLAGIAVCIAVLCTLLYRARNSREDRSSALAVQATPIAPAQLPPPAARAPTPPLPAINIDTALAAFREWLPRFEAAMAQGAAPANLLDEGRQLAEARQPAMLRLLRGNPLRALEQSVKWHEWSALPAGIRALVEEPFSATAELSVVPDCRPVNARQTPWQTHRVGMNGEWFDAFVYGRREWMSAKAGTPLQGIRLQNQMALWESAGLLLDAQDLAAVQNLLPDGNDRSRSWTTDQPINGAPVAALIGGKIHYFADVAEQQGVASVIAEAEAQPGPHNVVYAMAEATSGFGGTFNSKAFAAKASLAKSAWTENPKRVLAMVVDYAPPIGGIYSSSQLASVFFDASNSFRTMSFNKTWISNTVVRQTLTISNNLAYWETNSTGSDGIMATAKGLAEALGYVLTNYDIYSIAMPAMQRHAGAAAFAGGQHLWFNGGPHGPVVATHELGHNYGYGHANYWRGSTGAGLVGHPNGTGGVLEHEEYGDVFEIMGEAYSVYPDGHFSPQMKALFNWIETNEVVTVTTSGVYRVRRFDHINARLLAGTKLALQARNALGDTFWVGNRRALTNANYVALATGAYVTWANSPNSHRLIDTTRLSVPNSGPAQEKYDAPLQPGQSWLDPSGTLRITTLGAGGSSPNEYLDVAVDLLSNSPPFQLFTTSNRTTNGLIGSYVNSSLRPRLAQEDWRSTAGVTISGTRVDPAISFINNDWGTRAPVGVTGGTDADWEDYSVQWDGWVQVNRATKFATKTDDGSRMWIDFNGNGSFAATTPEFINNNWGNGQGTTLGEISATVPPGFYRIRIQYEEGVGANYCELVGSPVEFELFTDAALTTNGLTGSYVNTSLRSYSAQDDWRTSQTISGTRRDAYPLFFDNAFAEGPWGNRTNVGITGGSNADWDNYSVQWDGWIRFYTPTKLATISDDASRMWVDVNGNGTFAATAPEFINNHWGSGQGDTYGDNSAVIDPGIYRVRIQYEEGNGGNHFALYGAPQETPDVSGYALYFDGVDDFMIVSNAGLSLPTGDVTVEFWQRTYERRDQFTFILSADNLVNRFSLATLWGDGNHYWDFGNINTSGRLAYVPTTNIIGTWQHWAVVSSLSGNFQRIYRNGVLEASDSNASVCNTNGVHLVLGGRAGAAFKGELDEFRIWDKARTQEEIRENMFCRFPTGSKNNLWAYWRFDDASGNTVTDLSGNGRDGTLVGGTDWVVSTIPALRNTFTNVVTTLADSGAGSLRAAITNVNACDCSSVITFGVNGTINLAESLPYIFSSAAILGPGTNNLTINGGGLYSIFNIASRDVFGTSGTTNRISGLTLANARSFSDGASLLNKETTVLENCVISNSVTLQSSGGAVANRYTWGVLLVTNCVFVNNTISGGAGENRGPGSNGGPGGGGAGMGGAIYTDGVSLTLSGCTFRNNVAAGGNGGNGDGNSFNNDVGGSGGFPNRGSGGNPGQPGGAGGFGGGGGGGAGSSTAGFAGGTGGFGGGGGAGGARGLGGDGGAAGVGGPFGGAAGGSFASHSGGGGGGAGLGGAVFIHTGSVTIANCTFIGNLATNGVGGYGSFGGGIGQSGDGVGGAIFYRAGTLSLVNPTYSGNVGSSGVSNFFDATLTVISLADSGAGTLRDLVANAPVHSRITFAPGLAGKTIVLTSGELFVNRNLTFDASSLSAPVTVSGNNSSRVFNIISAAAVWMDSLCITAGRSPSGGPGAPLDGGGIFNQGVLGLNNCLVVSNRTADGPGPSRGGYGGGIYNAGALSLTNSFVAYNITGNGGSGTFGGGFGGNGGRGGGIYSAGSQPLTLLRTTIAGNVTGQGGTGSSANGDGGSGAGIHVASASGTLSMLNSTVASNATAARGNGGALFNAGTAIVVHCALVGNSVTSASGDGIQSSGPLTLENSIVANGFADTATDVSVTAGLLTRAGANAIGRSNGSPFTAGAPNVNGDYVGTAASAMVPGLAPLANFGGVASIMPPLPGALVIDRALATSGTPPTDQRGASRTNGPRADIGAVEAFPFSTIPLVDTDSDGIDDRLEPAYGHVVGVDNSTADSDGDGSKDAAELANMTDPLNAQDYFRILSFTKAPGFNPISNRIFIMALKTFPGVSYRLESGNAVTNFVAVPNTLFTATNYTRTQQVLLPPNAGFLRARRN